VRIAGLVLAGGRSSRFGREKAMATFRGEPLIAHVARVLARGCERVATNAPVGGGAAAWAEARGLPRVPDAETHQGPLFGVLAGLRWATADGCDLLVAIPCDLPLLPADFVARLCGCDEGGAVACDAEGVVQPLCSAWPVELRGALEAELARGHPPARAVVERLNFRKVGFCEARAFWNINTPADLRE
jgi:molybdopterin-guanine dinucleotide biosynthesis protein A